MLSVLAYGSSVARLGGFASAGERGIFPFRGSIEVLVSEGNSEWFSVRPSGSKPCRWNEEAKSGIFGTSGGSEVTCNLFPSSSLLWLCLDLIIFPPDDLRNRSLDFERWRKPNEDRRPGLLRSAGARTGDEEGDGVVMLRIIDLTWGDFSPPGVGLYGSSFRSGNSSKQEPYAGSWCVAERL